MNWKCGKLYADSLYGIYEQVILQKYYSMLDFLVMKSCQLIAFDVHESMNNFNPSIIVGEVRVVPR